MIPKKSRNRWLDILRAAAIILVVNCHVASVYSDVHGPNSFLSILGLGGHGVDLFFILSGWLLGHVLFKELERSQTIDLSRFFQRRWLRTLPAYYAVLGLTFLQALWQSRLDWADVSYVVFLQTYVFESCPFFAVSWSLCVEEHFYLLIAPIALWIGKSNPRGIFIFLIILTLPQLFRIAGFYGNLQQSHVRLDQCAAGVALAFAHLRFPLVWRAIEKAQPVLVVVAIGLLAWGILSRLKYTIPPPLAVFTIMSCIAVTFAERSDWWKSQVHIPGAYYIATRSYSIYLIHVESIAIVKRIDVGSFFLQAGLIWGITLLLAELLYRSVELPFMNLRERKPKPGFSTSEIGGR